MTQEANLQGNPLIPSHPDIQAQHAQAGPPAPAAQPAQTPPAATPQMDWSALMFGDGEVPQATAPAAGTAPPSATPAQPAQPSQPELTPEQKIELARTQQEQAQAPQPGQPSAVPVDQAMSQAVNHLLSTTYKLTDEQKRKLISEPDVAIPQLAANLHVQVATQLAQYMHQALPGLVQNLALQTMQKQMGAIRAEQSFFGKYPTLANPQFRPVILQCLKYAAQLNPGATRDKVMDEAAGMAAWKLKVNLSPQQQQQPPQQPQQRQPAQPVMQLPFTPAQAAGATVPAQPANPNGQNPFEALAMDTDW